MNSLSIFLLSILFGYIGFGLLARWYVMPWLTTVSRQRALSALIVPHLFRYVGLAFLVPGVTTSALPSAFAQPVAYGDLATVVLALAALIALRSHRPFALLLVWLFNVVGTLDFLDAYFQGFSNRMAPGQMGATFFIPTVAVPALMVTHILIFILLLRSSSAPKEG